MTPIKYLSIRLPWPPSELSPNSRNRWAKIKAVKEARELVAAILFTECVRYAPGHQPTKKPLAVHYKFYPPTRRWYDVDGLVSRCKAYQDQVFEHLGVDDHLAVYLTARRGKVVKHGAVEITVEEDDEANL